MLGLSIDLTESGLGVVDSIIECVFSYIGMLNAKGPQDWVYEELVNTQEMDFRFVSKVEPATYASNLANNMQLLTVNKVIAGVT